MMRDAPSHSFYTLEEDRNKGIDVKYDDLNNDHKMEKWIGTDS